MAHQAREVEEALPLRARAEWWSPGTGKTLPVLAQAAELAGFAEIHRCLVLAPKGVHSNWILHEAAKHLHPHQLPRRLAWSTERASTRDHRAAAAATLKGHGALVAMSYDSAMTDAGTEFCQRFLKEAPAMLVVDESHRVKTPGAARTKRVRAMAAHAARVRVLTGTPCDNSPFDAYSQVAILDPAAWAPLGISNAAAFRAYFGLWEKGYNRTQGREYASLKGYRNMEQLQEVMLRYGRRVHLADVVDLPPQTRSRVYFDMTGPQRKVYDQLREELRAILPDSSEASCLHKMVLLTRLRQVAAGYVPADDDRVLRELVPADRNPRLAALEEVLEDHPGQALVWCVRDADVDQVLTRLPSAVRYDGRDDDTAREAALAAFRAGSVRTLVSKPSVGGVGLTLNEAVTSVYYSSDFNLTDRRQSEARNYRRGQERPVHVVDVVAERSVDEYVLAKLGAKRQLSAELLGDDPDAELI